MKIITDLSRGKLLLGDAACIEISCRVRSLRNGTRDRSEVVLSIPRGLPYDPMLFPVGLWDITGVEWQEINGKAQFDYNVYGPVKIRTNAWQWVKVWALDKDGDYFRERGDEVKDYGYLFHYSVSPTTLGCIRIAKPAEAIFLGHFVERCLSEGEKVESEVAW